MQLGMYMVTAEDFVPPTHYLRRIDAVLQLSFVYEETAHLYSRNYGRPPIDPVVLVKYILLGYLEHIRSERELEIRCDQTPVYRWFIGVDLFDAPDKSSGHRTQQIDIHYNFVGEIDLSHAIATRQTA